MRRREFITLLASMAAASPLAARAQQVERERRIGVLMGLAEDDRDAQSGIDAFQQRLKDLGWSGSANSKIDVRWAASDLDHLRGDAKELVSLQPDVILASSTVAVAALKSATSTLPIVFVGANDPVGADSL